VSKIEHDGVEILLVEDDPNDVELTLRAFRKINLANRVRVARDGEEALQLIFGAEGAPAADLEDCQVILLDLKLPKIDGIEVLRRVKADPRTHDLPVVALTTSREDRDILECYRLGVNSYIVKPVDFEQFLEAVRTLGLYWLLLNKLPKS
jgi:two-component system, response regulator